MRYTPCETHRIIGAELERQIQSTTTADELLLGAGWRPVWIRMHADAGAGAEQYVLGWGAWVCPMHVREFKLKAPRRSRAKARKGSSRS